MKVIRLNYHYKSLLLLLLAAAYLAVVFFCIVPYFRDWEFHGYTEHILTIGMSLLCLLIFPLFFQFCLKMFISFTQKQQELHLDTNGILLPDFYLRFWSLDMKKNIFVPYNLIQSVTFSDIPNPLYPQKNISFLYKGPRRKKRICFCDNQFSRGIVDYHVACDFLKAQSSLTIIDQTQNDHHE